MLVGCKAQVEVTLVAKRSRVPSVAMLAALLALSLVVGCGSYGSNEGGEGQPCLPGGECKGDLECNLATGLCESADDPDGGTDGEEDGACEPDCAGKVCGDDGCGGTCGSCTGEQTCEQGQCVCASHASQACHQGDVWWFDGCGDAEEMAVSCENGCTDGTCDDCQPDCPGRECGPDGCGGTCAPGCGEGQTCNEDTGQCGCEPDCAGRECGPDGCGGTCAPGCGDGQTCNEVSGQCGCEPDCAGRECGPDGCGGTCLPGCDLNEACDEQTGLCQTNVVTLSRYGDIKLHDIAAYQHDVISRACQFEGQSEFFICGGSGPFYNPEKHPFVMKMTGTGDRLWTHVSGAATTHESFVTCAADAAGGVYLVYSENDGTIGIERVHSDGAALVWERSISAQSPLVAAYAATGDGAGGLLFAAQVDVGGDSTSRIYHYQANGDELWSTDWGTGVFPTAIEHSAERGILVAGMSGGDYPRDIFVLELDDGGTLVRDDGYGAGGADMIPRYILTREELVFIGGRMEEQAMAYLPHLWIFERGADTFSLSHDVVLPNTDTTCNGCPGVLLDQYSAVVMQEVAGNIIVGYNDPVQQHDYAIAVVSQHGDINWQTIYGADNKHECFGGLFLTPNEYYLITAGYKNVAYSNHGEISTQEWAVGVSME